MRVQIFLNGTLLGGANLMQPDPPMGIAMGSFEPAEQYDCRIHANTVEGIYLGAPGASFIVISDDRGQIDHVGVAIEDFAESMGERLLTIFGIPYPQYSSYFADYADYKAYYPST